MTYSISVTGHGDEPYEERAEAEKLLLGGIFDVLDASGGNVMTFSFQGNEVKVASWDEAKAAVEDAS